MISRAISNILFKAIQDSKTPIILNGVKGSGKSVLLKQTVDYFKNHLNWIVINQNSCSKYTNGTQEYSLNQNSNYFNQEKLQESIINQVFSENKNNLPFDPSIKSLDALLSHVSTLDTPVLVSLDEINHFYTKTAYYDQQSHVVSADKLTLVRTWHHFINNLPANVKFIGAQDMTKTMFKSHAFDSLVKTAPCLNPTPNVKTISNDSISSLKTVDKYGVKLPFTLDKSVLDNFDTKSFPTKIQRFDIEPFSFKEIHSLLDEYRAKSILHIDPSTVDVDKLVTRMHMLTNGNPEKLINQIMIY